MTRDARCDKLSAKGVAGLQIVPPPATPHAPVGPIPVPGPRRKQRPATFASIKLVSQALVATRQVDDPAITETVLPETMLHDAIVPVGIDTDVRVLPAAPVQYAPEDAVGVREAGEPVYDMIGHLILQPFTALDVGVRGFRGREKGEIGYRGLIVLHQEATAAGNITPDNVGRRIPVLPLMQVPRPPHNLPSRLQDLQNGREICLTGGPYASMRCACVHTQQR